MTGGVLQVTVRGVPLDVLGDMLPVFEPVEQLVCLDVKDPQEVVWPWCQLQLLLLDIVSLVPLNWDHLTWVPIGTAGNKPGVRCTYFVHLLQVDCI